MSDVLRNDRVHVTGEDGVKLGWGDVLTGELHPASPALEPLLAAALRASPHWSHSREPDSPWTDLALAVDHRGHHRAASLTSFIDSVFGLRRAQRAVPHGEGGVLPYLTRLPASFHLLYSVPAPDGPIPFVLVGPPGIVTVEVKSHPGSSVRTASSWLYVDGVPTDYVMATQRRTRRISALLAAQLGHHVHTWPVIVIASDDVTKVRLEYQPRGVRVVHGGRAALRHISSLQTQYSDGEVASIYEIARRSTTWG